MQLDESYQNANSQFADLLYNGGILSKSVLVVLCCVCIILLIYALTKKLKRRWESAYFVLLCACVVVWAGCSLAAEFMSGSGAADGGGLGGIGSGSGVSGALIALRNIGLALIPALLCAHVQLQVSYKELRPVIVGSMLVVPVFLSLLVLRDAAFPNALAAVPAFNETMWFTLLFYAYAAVCLIRAYLLCFDVFYQMPKHMRRSTRYILLSVSAISLLLVMDVLWKNSLSDLLPHTAATDVLLPLAAPLALLLLIYPLYSAMHLMPAEDVIVTSREFVVGGLSTTIFVLGGRKQILDWNRKDWDEGYPLPKPLYKEPLEVYRKRIIDSNTCRVSKHDSDIVTTSLGGVETHFLMRTREVRNRIKRFGYVLEISDITPVYTIMRYFEEIAHYDQLTKLHNRNAYIAYVQQIVEAELLPLLIFVGDVNGLKTLNDSQGHVLGDVLLKAIADIIQEAAPPEAFLARVGGDEYVVLIPHGTDDDANRFVQDVISLCSATHHEAFGSPSISWGYSIMTSREQSYNEVFEQADAMMYAYKKGRNMFTSSGLVPD
ncbi:MAG: diguanylate cyclase [Oscillospiraceae bacterium]|nr:diguanylate cyclase [Oscillospiraceae bacterium]